MPQSGGNFQFEQYIHQNYLQNNRKRTSAAAQAAEQRSIKYIFCVRPKQDCVSSTCRQEIPLRDVQHSGKG